MRVECTTLAEGEGSGRALVLSEALSFWGSVDPATGRIVDPRHPQHGRTVTGAVLVMPSGRGSTSSSSVLAESVRAGTAPQAIVLADPDPILAVGSGVASDLYGVAVPVVVVGRSSFDTLRDGDVLRVHAAADGTAELRRP